MSELDKMLVVDCNLVTVWLGKDHDLKGRVRHKGEVVGLNLLWPPVVPLFVGAHHLVHVRTVPETDVEMESHVIGLIWAALQVHTESGCVRVGDSRNVDDLARM